MMHCKRISLIPLAWTCCLIFLAACSSSSTKPVVPPIGDVKVLQPLKQTWSLKLPVSRQLNQSLQVINQRVAVSSVSGQVTMVDLAQGKQLWQIDTGKPLQTGAGFDGDSVAVVSVANELSVLQDGKQLWQKRLPAQSFTNPVVAGERVFVLLADRSVMAFDKADGKRLWTQQRPGEPLVLKQSGVLMPFQNTLLASMGGSFVGLNPDNGQVLWDLAIANPRGLNDLERLVDLVGTASRVNNSVCVRAFQAQLGCVNPVRGMLMWNRASVGNKGLSGDETTLVGTESNGVVRAWNRASGERLWDTDRLKYRDLSQPLWTAKGIVITDEGGWLYVLSGKDGSLLNRLQTPAQGFASSPTALDNDGFVVLTRDGLLLAYQLP
ncbi:MAG: outer membrane protein assembly factor BamB [Limnohabitans sp.]|nr:outer membrane protein assembly factor BamB [Limnohabitans sp.]